MAHKSKAADIGGADMPVYELDSYEPVSFTMPSVKVSDEQVAAQMRSIAERFGGDYVDSERTKIGPKDSMEIDIEIRRDDEVVKNLTAQDRLYTVGAGLMPIDFDRGILGMEVGQTRKFEFNAPDFEEGSNGAERSFAAKVTLKKVKDKVDPVIDDAWVAKYMPLYKSADDFREQTRKDIGKSLERELEQERNARAVQALSERFHGKIDDRFYEEGRANMMAGYEQQAKMQGMDLEDFIGKQGMDQNQFMMMLMMQVRAMLVEGFSLDAWARHYNIEPTDDDVRELADIMSQGNAQAFLAHLEESEDEKKAFETATKRYAANKDLAATATISREDDSAPFGVTDEL